VIFGAENVTTGASNDFQQVSRVARQMVERFGFSKKIGQVALGGGGGNPFLGQQVSYGWCSICIICRSQRCCFWALKEEDAVFGHFIR
jgi:hypothetical protein